MNLSLTPTYIQIWQPNYLVEHRTFLFQSWRSRLSFQKTLMSYLILYFNLLNREIWQREPSLVFMSFAASIYFIKHLASHFVMRVNTPFVRQNTPKRTKAFITSRDNFKHQRVSCTFIISLKIFISNRNFNIWARSNLYFVYSQFSKCMSRSGTRLLWKLPNLVEIDDFNGPEI